MFYRAALRTANTGLVGLLLVLSAVGCSRQEAPARSAADAATSAADAATSAAPGPVGVASGSAVAETAASSAAGPMVVFLGDSLTAGYGLDAADAFPAQLAAELAADGAPIEAVNAGISGDTTSGGAGRIDWVLERRPAVVVVALGANDGLRGLPLDEMERNLRTIIERAQGAGAKVVLAGMRMPPNLGPDYTQAFAEVFPKLAREYRTEYVPFLLDGVAGRPRLNQEDGIHPTAEGQRILAENVRPHLEAALGR